jgi:hypothetical protein
LGLDKSEQLLDLDVTLFFFRKGANGSLEQVVICDLIMYGGAISLGQAPALLFHKIKGIDYRIEGKRFAGLHVPHPVVGKPLEAFATFEADVDLSTESFLHPYYLAINGSIVGVGRRLCEAFETCSDYGEHDD